MGESENIADMVTGEDVTKNVFYWTRVATVVAQGSGMHRRRVFHKI